MELGLKGKVALVTGASQGIGLATAQRLAGEGAVVVMNARGAERLEEAASRIRASGGIVHAVAADVGRSDECERLVDVALRAGGGHVDILVNNAGTSSVGEFLSLTDERWQDDLDLKLFAAIRLIRMVIPSMQQKRSGRIVNITNIGAKQPAARSMPTTVTRAAGQAMTTALSKELAPHGILVNTVCIGLVRAGQHEARAKRDGVPVEKLYEDMARSIPLGRVGHAEEVANVIAFLASEAASFVTGSSINLDGGASSVF
jgi:NAD(P)-dependent dehydrogenase (short-subunit alcohol dehydrogenase family)